jgi:alkylation response protein AidB-like acyl-CoA dehydrogenase
MRQATVQAVHHTAHRSAFGSTLVDQPLMRVVLADLAVESEAATVTASARVGNCSCASARVTAFAESIAVSGDRGVANWRVSFRDDAGSMVEVDGILVCDFDAAGLCVLHREWYDRLETPA